jgi:uncharacterized protein (TIGR03067 family)
MKGNLWVVAVLGVILVVAPGLLPAGDKKEPKSPTDKERLQGTWKVISLEVNGNLEKSDVGKTLTFDGDKLLPQGLEDAKITVQLNPEETPKEFDLLVDGKVFLKGIYKLDGDTLTACYPSGADARGRPKEFSGAEGRRQVLLTAKKDKGKER